MGQYSRSISPEKAKRVYQHRDGTSQRRRGCIHLLMLVRPSARLAYKTCLRTPQREDAAPKSPEARRQFTRTEPSPADVGGAMRPRARHRAREERTPNGCAAQTRRRGSTGNAGIQFAGELASQRPPSRERPPLGGGGAGRALSLSLCLSPRSRSIDDAEHRLRQVRGPPACSSAGT